MQASSIFLLILFATPIPFAFFAGGQCRSRLARRLLRYGAALFALLLLAATLFLMSCDGDLIYGLRTCGPWGYTPPGPVAAATGLVYAAYVVIGPVLVVVAIIAERRARRQPGAPDRPDRPV